MPEYPFTCAACGPFELRRPAGEAGWPASCPTCGKEARRVYAAPGLTRTPAPVRAALAAEERSAHEPAITREKQGSARPHAHRAAPPWAIGHS